MHVYEKAIKSQIGEVYVATCDKEIASEVEKNKGNFIMTDRKHSNGTERVYEASKKLDLKDEDFIINLQGDEPMINPTDIINLNNISKENGINISTLAFNIKNKEDFMDENIVKVVTKNKISNKTTQEALNFYRVIKNINVSNIYHHFGIYLFRFSALENFVALKKSQNELNYRMEQLRAIDNNMKIEVILANYFSSGIDTKKDLDEYIKILNK